MKRPRRRQCLCRRRSWLLLRPWADRRLGSVCRRCFAESPLALQRAWAATFQHVSLASLDRRAALRRELRRLARARRDAP